MKYIVLLFTLALFTACEKSALNTTGGSVNRPVVEGFIQPGALPVVQVKKQLPYGSTDSVQHPILGLSVSIEDAATGVYYPLTHTDSSAYAADGSWQPAAGNTYRLHFDYDGQSISAETVVPAKPIHLTASATSIAAPVFGTGGPPSFSDPITLDWDASDGGYYLVVVQVRKTTPN